jgi:hypothetical protein
MRSLFYLETFYPSDGGYITPSIHILVYTMNSRCGIDSGRNWNEKRSVQDAMACAESVPKEMADELISQIRSTEEILCMTVHPERWESSGVSGSQAL